MSLLHKYILHQAVIGLLFITAGLLAILWLMQSARMLEIIISQGISPAAFLRITALGLPDFITLVTPAALAISAIFVLNRMGNDRELHIIAAAGKSPYQTARPIIWLSIATASVCYIMTLWLVPVCERLLKISMFNIRHEITNLSLKEKRFTKISDGFTIYARKRENDGSYRGIIISDTRTPGKKITIIAHQGTVMRQESVPKIALKHGSQHETQMNGKFSILQFDDAIADLDTFFDKDSSPINDFRSYSTLQMITADEENFTRASALKMRMNGHQRLVLPLMCPMLAIIACFGMLKHKFNRRSNMPKIIKTAVLLLAAQMLVLLAQNLASRYYWGPVFMYLAILLPTWLGLAILKKDNIYIAKWRVMSITAAIIMALTAGKNAKAAQFNQGIPLDFSADSIGHNFKTKLVTATGNVRVNGTAETLTADRIEYDIGTETLKAYGNVTITDDEGNKTMFDHAWLNKNFTQGYMRNLRIKMTDTTSIRAQELARKDGTFNVIKGGAYTACVQDCDERSPLWQVRAAKMIYNQETERIYYQHARLNVLGLPIFYMPYLSHPAPQVESQNGFMPPQTGSFNVVGSYVYLPYFMQISPYAQLTLSPLITFEQASGGIGADFNANYHNGNVAFTGLYARDDIHDDRGFINAQTTWDATDTVSIHAQAQWVSDDTFLRTYSRPEKSNPWLTSTIKGQYLTNDAYFTVGSYFYHDMRDFSSAENTPVILPLMQYSRTFGKLVDNSYFKFDSTGLVLTREKGDRMQRLTTTTSWVKPFQGKIGDIYNLTAALQADAYNVHNTAENYDGFAGRLSPSLQLSAELPMAAYDSRGNSYILSPTINAAISPNDDLSNHIPNEDSQDLELDVTNIMLGNRFYGHDRIETGTRFNYGINANMIFGGEGNNYINTFLGQSYRFYDDPYMPAMSGLKKGSSDIVGAMQANIYDFAALEYKFLMDNRNLKINTSELSAHIGKPVFNLGMSYVFVRGGSYAAFPDDREEINAVLSSKISDKVTAQIFGIYDMHEKQSIYYGSRIAYIGDCMDMDFYVNREFTRDRDYDGDISFGIRFALKTISNFAPKGFERWR